MTNLGSDSYFNKWEVPLIPFAKLVKVTPEQHAKMLNPLAEKVTTADMDDGITADELSLKDALIPSFTNMIWCWGKSSLMFSTPIFC